MHNTDRIRLDDNTYAIVCVNCGEEFLASRYDASFCSSGCRVAHHRVKQQRKKREERAKQALNAMLKGMPKHQGAHERDTLLWMRRRIENILDLMEETRSPFTEEERD